VRSGNIELTPGSAAVGGPVVEPSLADMGEHSGPGKRKNRAVLGIGPKNLRKNRKGFLISRF
jgi:hypothetical protein